MPLFETKTPTFKSKRKLEEEWKTFRKGLNLLLRPTELTNEEMAQADNVLLEGSGSPKGRWGTLAYFTVNATGSIRGIGTYIDQANSVNEIFALSDEGYLAKKDGSSSTQIAGLSYPSGSIIRAEQLGGATHIVSKDAPFTSYDGGSLEIFATISAPTGLSATNFSGATGEDRVSYKVTTLGSNGGETTASDNYVLTGLPTDLTDTEIHLFWTAPSAATLSGYQIYRGLEGDETLLSAVGSETTYYVDRGTATSEIITSPLSNTTGGVESEFIAKYKDRLIVVDATDPNKVLISGRFPNHTKFNWVDGGGYIYVDPDSGDDVTGVVVQPIADRIVIYKSGASYLVELSTVTIGNFIVLDPQYAPISTAVGCSNQDTIATVENDSFYFGRDGIYVTGYEPNFLNIIRTNEVSSRIRPAFEDFGEDEFNTANAAYFDKKYILSIPTRKEMYVYDRERGAFAGKWILPFGISHMKRYVDGSGTERWVIGSYENNQIYTFDVNTNTDDGTTITKTLRTAKKDFGDWTRLSIIRFFYILFRAITGDTTVNILVEDRAGSTTNAKTFTITGAEVAGRTGWGINKWGQPQWGESEGSFSPVATEITRWGPLFKQSRLVQVEVTSSATASNFELLSIKLTATPQTEGSLSATQRV
jgi:hypothetical protein